MSSPLKPISTAVDGAKDSAHLVRVVDGSGNVAGSSATYAGGTVSVDATAEVIRAANATRKELVVQNVDSTGIVYLGEDATVTTSNGLRLMPGDTRVYTNYTGAVWGIGSEAAVDVRFEEIG